jgi:hypothetical protein
MLASLRQVPLKVSVCATTNLTAFAKGTVKKVIDDQPNIAAQVRQGCRASDQRCHHVALKTIEGRGPREVSRIVS